MAGERSVLEILEAAAAEGDPAALPVQLAYLSAEAVGIGADELAAALRRALLVLASGGDPHREPAPDSPAVATLAADLSTPERRAALQSAFEALEAEADGLPLVGAALAGLRGDGELAWVWLACALLADELG